MARPPKRQLAIQASQRDRDCHREPPCGPVWEATGADHHIYILIHDK